MKFDWNAPFKPKDFEMKEPLTGTRYSFDLHGLNQGSEIAEMANERFRELIEKCPIVYSREDGPLKTIWFEEAEYMGTTKARIIAMEKIKEK